MLVVTIVARAAETEPAILAKARARLGSEAALEGLKTIHYVGTLTTADPRIPPSSCRRRWSCPSRNPTGS